MLRLRHQQQCVAIWQEQQYLQILRHCTMVPVYLSRLKYVNVNIFSTFTAQMTFSLELFLLLCGILIINQLNVTSAYRCACAT